MGQGDPGGRHQGGVEPFCSRPDIPYFPFTRTRPHRLTRCASDRGSQHRMIGCRLKPWVILDRVSRFHCRVNVRFAPKATELLRRGEMTRGARNRLMRRSKRRNYSITSSAVASSDGAMAILSALAVLRLITSSNFVGCWTGRSAGLAPFRIRST